MADTAGNDEIMKTFREDPLPRSGKRDDPSVGLPKQATRPLVPSAPAGSQRLPPASEKRSEHQTTVSI